MTLVSELELAHIPVEDPAFWADPMPGIEAARLQHPWLATTSFGYFIHGYQAMKDILPLDKKLRPNFEDLVEHYQAKGTPWADFQVEQLIGHSGAKHIRIRTSVGDAFTPRSIAQHIDLIQSAATKLLDEWAPKGEFDFPDFASYYPISVLCGLMGTSTEEIPSIREALETQGRVMSMDPAIVPELLSAYHVLWDFCDRLILAREKHGGKSGLIDEIIAAKTRGAMDETELRYLLIVLFVAGYDTSKNMLALTMKMMLEYPEYWKKCAESVEFAGKVTQEIFRYTSTATMSRAVNQEFEYEGVTFPVDTKLMFGNSTAGRDPRCFDDPDTFNPEREQTVRHVAFGRGVHVCLGQHLAQTQIAHGLHLMAQRMRNPRLVGEIVWRPFLGTWGIEKLPIAFDPA